MKIYLSLHRKMMALLIPASLLVFGGAITYIISQAKKKAIADTVQIANESAEKFAQIIKSDIDKEFDVARSMSYSFKNFYTLDIATRTPIYNKILDEVMLGNPQYVSFWLNFELHYSDSNFLNKSGRGRFTYFRDQYGKISYMTDTLDLDGGNINAAGAYQKMKLSKLETIVEPYYYSYTGRDDDAVLETSICVPLLKDGEFAGLVGSDILLDHFQDLISNIDIYGGGSAFFLSNQGKIIAFPNEEKIGENFQDLYPDIDKKYALIENIKLNKKVAYQDFDFITGKESYVVFLPIIMGKSVTPWCFGVSVPFDSINQKAKSIVATSIVISIIGILILSILIYLIARAITNPLKRTTFVLRNISEGNIDASEKLNINTGDEIEEMSESVNQLIDGLGKTADFAKEIGQGNLDAEFSTAGANDKLGNSLLEMRKSLKQAEKEEEKRKVEDEKINWATQGLAKFGDILRQHDQNISELSFNILSNLVDYVGAIQGSLFVKNDDNEDEVVFEMTGAIAYDRNKVKDEKFLIGEGLVGRCAHERLTIYLEEVPQDYVHITSGLGDANPNSILLVPAILNDEVYGIIELVSFNKFEQYQIDFIEKIGESIASTVSNARVSDRTNNLLSQSKQQAEELAAQEEEMRQNLEELQATQEEIGRLREEDRIKNQKLIDEIEKHKKTLSRILDHLPVKVFLKDTEGKMLIVNKRVLDVHGTKREDLIGKSDFDFIDDYNQAKKYWDAEQNIIKSGKAFNEIHTETINDTGMILDSTKYPFYIDYLEETGILGVQVDITELMQNKEKIKALEEELKKYK